MNILKDLMLEEVSLVDRPANAQAEVVLFKRDNQVKEDVEKMSDYDKKVKAYMEKGYSEEEAKKMCDRDMKAEKADDLEASVDDLKKQNEDLRKALIENGFVISKEGISKKEEVEMLQVEGVMVAKSDIPEPVLKALEAAEVEKKDMALTKMAEDKLGNMPVEKAKELLKSFEENDEMMQFFMALDAALGGAFEEVGKADADGDMGDPQAKLDNMVATYKAENKVSKEKAFAEVVKTAEGKQLLKEVYKKEND